jgi:hypothetical protein
MKKLIAFLFISSIVVSCVKPVTPNQNFCAEGHIFWGGNPATDPNGIGYYFAVKRTGNWKFYQVKDAELEAQYKSTTDSIAVNICLESTNDKAPCPCAEPSFYYKVKSISRR